MAKRIRKFTKHRKLLLAAVIVIAAVVIWLVFFHSPKKVVVIPSTSPARTAVTSKQSVSNVPATAPSSSSTKSSAAATPPSTSEAPTTPYGTFVSNHSPGQNGSPTTESSTCNTTPGATCYIEFTMGSQVQKLGAQTADSNGAVYWSWDVSTAGLSSGSWTITAYATLNGQTATASDSQPLVVQ